MTSESPATRGRYRSIRLLMATFIALAISACGDSAPAPVAEAAPAISAAGTEHPMLPLPQPSGEGTVGARLREYAIDLTRDTVPAGEVEFHVVNSGTTTHWLLVRNETTFSGTPHLLPGDSAVLNVTLEPGEYHIVCTIRDEFDHISEGMRRTFIVQ